VHLLEQVLLLADHLVLPFLFLLLQLVPQSLLVHPHPSWERRDSAPISQDLLSRCLSEPLVAFVGKQVMLEVCNLNVRLRMVLILLVQRVPIYRLLLERLQIPFCDQLLLMDAAFILSRVASSGKALTHRLQGELVMVIGSIDLELRAAVTSLEERVRHRRGTIINACKRVIQVRELEDFPEGRLLGIGWKHTVRAIILHVGVDLLLGTDVWEETPTFAILHG